MKRIFSLLLVGLLFAGSLVGMRRARSGKRRNQ